MMKKIISAVALFFVVISAASAVRINKEDFSTTILAKVPRMTGNQIFNGSDAVEFGIVQKPLKIKTFCLTVDPQLPAENVGTGTAVAASDDAGNVTWWLVPYLDGTTVQRWCFNTQYGYHLSVYWDTKEDKRFSEDRVLAVNSAPGSKGWATNLLLEKGKKKKVPLVSPQLHDFAIACQQAYCVDQGYGDPGMVEDSVVADKGTKTIRINMTGSIPSGWFIGDVSAATKVCLRSNTAGWSGDTAYCVLVSFETEMTVPMLVDGNGNILEEEFTFTAETPSGSVWSDNSDGENSLFSSSSGLVRSGENLKVAP